MPRGLARDTLLQAVHPVDIGESQALAVQQVPDLFRALVRVPGLVSGSAYQRSLPLGRTGPARPVLIGCGNRRLGRRIDQNYGSIQS